MKKIKLQMDLFCMSYLALLLDEYLCNENRHSLYFKAALFDCRKKLSTRVKHILSDDYEHKKFRVTVRFDQFMALLEFMKEYQVYDHDPQLLILYGELDQIKTNLIHQNQT